MTEIMIRCPTLGTAVQTGLRTETIIFESIIEDLSIPMDCPACLKVHRWQPREAWVLNGANGTKSIPKDD